MDTSSLAGYGLAAQQALDRQMMQVSMIKQAHAADQAAVDLVTDAAHSGFTVPTSAEAGKGTIVDITV